MTKRPTLHASGVHRLPEGPSSWRLDDTTRQRALAGIAQARAALAAALASQGAQATTFDPPDHAVAA